MARPLGSTDLKRLHREWRRLTPGRVALILENIQSPFNVGAIVRTAAAYRVETVWVVGETPDLADRRVGKTALGCDRYLRSERAVDAASAVQAARSSGYRVVALELADDARALHELELPDDVCLVAGHEDRGLRPSTLEACDEVAFLPQLGKIGSLNVATATAIAVYEVRRRAWSAE